MDEPEILHDPARLATLAATELLDTPVEEAFDRITRLAHQILNVPIALCNLVTEDRSFIKSSYGLAASFAPERQVPLAHCFCQWVLASDGPLVVEDVAGSEFGATTASRALNIRGFIGVPLIVRGHRVGVFNLVDTRPRQWTPRELAAARDLAATAAGEIELRLALKERTRAQRSERRRADAMALIAEVGMALTKETRLPKQLRGCARAITRRLAAGFLGFWRYDESEDLLTLESKTGSEVPPGWLRVALRDGSRIALIAAEQRPYFTNSLELDDSLPARWAAHEGFVSFSGHPLVTDGRLIGVGAMFARQPLRESSFRALGTAANMLALAVLRDRTQRDIAQSEQRFRALVESSAQIVFRADPSGAIISASWPSVDGEDLKRPVGRRWRELLHPDDRELVDARWTESIAKRSPYFQQFRIRHRDGYHHYEVRCVPIADEDGHVREWMGAATDVTERKRARASLQLLADAGELLARSIGYESTINGVAQITVGAFADICLILLMNDEGRMRPVAAAATDPAKRTLIESHFQCLDHPYHEAFQAMANGETLLVRHADEVWKRRIAIDDAHYEYMRALDFHSLIAAPIVGTEQPFGAIVFGRCHGSGKLSFSDADVALASELGRRAGISISRARLYERLREREKELADSNERKDEFLAMLSHELRNPLAPIAHALHILGSGVDPSRQKWAREIIKRQTGHMVRLVDDLLDVSRVTRGKITLQRARVELGAIVTTAVETVRSTIEDKRQRLSIHLPTESIWLDADEARLVQVMSNLLNNAVKFTPDQGEITIAAERDGEIAVIKVHDSGAGIAPNQLERIFALFAQADNTLARSSGGLGIGLALVKRLVEMHGGTVMAASEGPGRGSEFVLKLPIAETTSKAGATEQSAPTLSEELAGRRILVVDDNVDSAESLALVLEAHGAQIKIAHDGASALASARSFAPDAILADIGLPDLSGYELAPRLRGECERPPLLIAVSGYGSTEARRRSAEAGFQYHMVKPVDVEAVLTVLSAGNGTALGE